ncbi:MAG: endonuclease [Thiotrichales bacterium SG8_50]|nr:MAG: endonuclease [Thiotrichales bacterium SG8_50]
MSDLAGRLDRCSINTATLGYQLPIGQTIEAVARAGFGAIAPWRRELEGESARLVSRRIRDAGLTVSGYCRSTYIPAASDTEFAENIEDNRRAIDDAAELGAACFVMVVGGLPQGSKDLADARHQVRDGIARLLEHAGAQNVPLAIEPLHPMYAADRACINTLRQALDLCDALDPSQTGTVGVAVDLYHVWWDPDLKTQILRAGHSKRLLGFHLCDWLVPTNDMLLDRGMMGDGVIDIHGVRRHIEASGYAGRLEVEIFSRDNWWKRPATEVLEVCAQRLQTVC